MSSPTAFAPVTVKIIVLYAASQVAGRADAFPNEKCPDRHDLEFEVRPAPQRHGAPMPCGPVDEEQDMARFFLYDRLERVDQFLRKETGTLGRFKQTKGEKAVDTLAVSGHHEGPFRIALHFVVRLGRQRDAVRRTRLDSTCLVPPSSNALSSIALRNKGSAVTGAYDADVESRPALGLHGDIPDGQTHQPLAHLASSWGQSMTAGL